MAIATPARSWLFSAAILWNHHDSATDTTMNRCLGVTPKSPADPPASSSRAQRHRLLPLLLVLAVSTSLEASAQTTASSSELACQLPPADSVHPVTPPRPRSEQIPPDGPNRPRGTFSISVGVTREGRIDTSAVAISPDMPRRYEVAFKKSLLKYRFYPAHRQGCPIPSTFRFMLAFE